MAAYSPSLNQNLIRVVIRGDAIAVQGLLDQGADPNTTGDVTALGDSNTALMQAASQGNLEIMATLLKYGADFRPKNQGGATTLSETRKSFRASQAVDLYETSRGDRVV
jgi:uncharacterized protein